MFEENPNSKYSTRPDDFYLSSKEIQEKRGEDLARRLYQFRKSLNADAGDSSYISSPFARNSSSSKSLEDAFLSEFLHLSNLGKQKFVKLIWVKNVQEEISQIWPSFSAAVNESLNKI